MSAEGGAGAERGGRPDRAAAWIGAANLIGRFTGMAREVAFTAVFGAGMVSDSFQAASRVPQLLRELLVEGSLQNAFVPAFLGAGERRGQEEAWRLANAFLGLLLVVLGGTVLLFWVGAPLFVWLIASEFSADPVKFELTVQLTRWLSPFLVGLSLAGLAGGMLNARGRFLLPAMSQNLLNLLVLAACLGAGAWERLTGAPPILLVAGVTTLSGFAQVAVLLPALRREGFRLRPTFAGHPDLPRMLRTFLPALVGISTVQLSLLIESQVAAGFGDGALSWLSLSFRLVQIPLMVVAGSVATATLSTLSLQEARQDRAGATDTLTRAIRLNSFLVLPCAVAFVALAGPITAFCFERGAFSAADTAGTAAMLRMYGIAAWGICFHRLAVPVLYALQRTRLPAVASAGALLLKLPVIALLTRGFGMGVEALPLSHALTVGGEAVVLLWGMRDRLGPGLAGAHLRMLIAGGALAAILWGLNGQAHVVIVCGVGGIGYLAAAWALRLPEIRALTARRGGLPPFLDPESRAAIVWMAGRQVEVSAPDVAIRLIAGGRAFRLAAERGSLRIEDIGEEYAENTHDEKSQDAAAYVPPEHDGQPSSLALIVRVGQGPPSLRGLEVDGRVFSAEDGAIREGACAGPRIPVRL